MNNLIIELSDNKYLIRYEVFKSVVSRKHTTKEGKVTNRLEIHPNSVVIYLYQASEIPLLNMVKIDRKYMQVYSKYFTYLGRGLSKCSDKDKFDVNIGILQALKNLLYKQENTVDDLEKISIIDKFLTITDN